MTTVSNIRAAGFDVRVALFRASEHVRYAMFMGGGLEWAETKLKAGLISLPPSDPQDEPDLTGLSCQWGPIRPQHDKIVSLIVKRAADVSDARFSEITAAVIEVFEAAAALNPVPAAGPEVRWPSAALGLQSSIAHKGRGLAWRRARTVAGALMAWLVFKLGLRIGGFNAAEYRREIAANTDFRKFDDALMMTVDCSQETIAQLKTLLQQAEAANEIRFGLHMQDEALMTCVVPSVQKPDHIHFVDGGGGGYTSAARQIKE